jgi:flavin-dependent dehydrogenase
MSSLRNIDVLVIGGGPAGTATALSLARSGATAAVLERSDYGGVRLGETVPPRILEPLAELGLAKDFLHHDHEPSCANVSAWGSPDLAYKDFLFDPRGHGWHLARNRFDLRLAEEAEVAGAKVLRQTRLVRLERADRGWMAEAGSGERSLTLTARLLVDATGRGCGIARRLGCQPLLADRLVGLAGYLEPEAGTPVGQVLLLEASESGWWYSAPLPDGRHVAVFMTDADLLPRGRARRDFWDEQLGRSTHTRQRLAAYRRPERLVLRPSHSFSLDRAFGRDFLAVGDAACAFDPLSSQGVLKALRSGLQAARSLLEHLDGRREALAEHDAAVRADYHRYLGRRAEHYALETRWPGSPFWRRRMEPAPATFPKTLVTKPQTSRQGGHGHAPSADTL